MNGLIDAMVGSAAMGVPQNKDNSFEKRRVKNYTYSKTMLS